MKVEPKEIACSGCRKAKAYRLPLHAEFVDGRSSRDWYNSVRNYLEWRAGASWRPARHRGPCAVDDYRDALHVLVQAFHTPVPEAVPTQSSRPPSPRQQKSDSPRRLPERVRGDFVAAAEVA